MKYFIFSIILTLTLSRGMCGKTNFVLVMTDDQGWGQTGYYNHPVLKTPNLDEMASNGYVLINSMPAVRFVLRPALLF